MKYVASALTFATVVLFTISSFAADDGDFLWAKAMGGALRDSGRSIFVDNSGNVYTTGGFRDTVDFGNGVGLPSAGEEDIFISKLDSNGDFLWAKAMGGTLWDSGRSVFVDDSGNVYIAGDFMDTVDFGNGVGLPSAGESDIFISKLDSNGDFLWAKAMGGTSTEIAHSIFVDNSGNVYITGNFRGTVDFGDGVDRTSAGGPDIFISKLDKNSNLVWVKTMGDVSQDFGTCIFVDSSGNVYTTGRFSGTVDFGNGVGLTSAGQGDIFISKLDSNGGFVWAKAMGGTSSDTGYSIFVDDSENVYTTGSFSGTVDFGNGVGLTSAGGPDIFISKLDSNGNFLWVKAMGGTSAESGESIFVDNSGNVYTTGLFLGTVDFGDGVGLSSSGESDIFISKLDSNSDFVWAKAIGGTSRDGGESIFVDDSGNIYTTGYFMDTVDFGNGSGLTSAGEYDIFVVKLSGSYHFLWSMVLPAIIGKKE